ncbi:S8 family serine peptidase [candidate division KSB1 bacterium]|nr:S8 family serine peptidase [candidate division KSB1 bacterium]
MKICLFTFALYLLCSSFAMANVGKLDPRLQRLALAAESGTVTESSILRKRGEINFVRVIATFDGRVHELAHAGAGIIFFRENMAILEVPLTGLRDIANLPSITYMEAPTPSKALLDKSAQAISAIKAREQLGATGRGIIVGIVDSGIDWRHDDFRKPDGSTRIKYILDLSEPGPHYTGSIYTEAQINDALNGFGRVYETDASGHGTHVTGIVAGDGTAGTGYGDYAGIAPAADIVAVKATRDAEGREFFTDDQIVALAFIDSVADVLGKPWVANLSLGGHSGAHDGTSPVERFIDMLTGPGIQGKVVVTVAGNDGDMDIHAQATIESSPQLPVISFHLDPYIANVGTGNDIVILDGWYDGARKIGVTLISPSGNRYGPVLPGEVLPDDNSSGKVTNEGTIYMWNGFYESGNEYRQGTNPHNGDREFYLQISDDDARRPADGEWTLEFSGIGGDIDVWISNATMDAYFVQGKVDDGKLAIPGTARNAITVASFISKKSWDDLDGNRLTYDSQGLYSEGDLSAFSSPGPVRKGGYQKPEIAAPGQIIVSALSVDAPPTNENSIFFSGNISYPNALVNNDGFHGLNSGTSMAAPHVTGAVALLLEQTPELSTIQVRDLITKSADSNSKTGAVPNTLWGWGKLNIHDALLTDPDPEEEQPVFMLHPPWPNPFVGTVKIEYDLPVLENMPALQIVIFNALGRRVKEIQKFGGLEFNWDGRDDSGTPVGSGVYFIQASFGRQKQLQKVVFLGMEK